ncbi:MAG: hypothetical protein COW00_18920 [Bdellovibrio sp. CG12_big_fil_rev_8_21_14_0_65_39_13]|nr:MAG: hypothetical protein COW78_17355 [Bdellovibrio sp. CG22_combo_CG10-13_8_21_14_all_39_27]PIQ57771.1 MAG: hypothetical protein COW00_18920 [Bdellovibrio sp. CG12_big_fil_rev_8_21_14_0_65_39_13]PIR34644.1 MAG: hypothetical protein COV37_11970 [Bdellovibrio sp. CG11_big_fil_rev_8_21_14_0_20_39_38]PJB54684.1 MAG: hypothetical protein CO099_00170 [Bdellovibrio sp. CG_4_9_14_3_um_filter_39_7]
MSLSFSEIKETIMEEVRLSLTERIHPSNEETITLEWTVSPFDTLNIINELSTSPFFYFKDKEGENEYLGLGKYRSFTSMLELDEIEKLSLKNPRWFFSFTQHFDQQNKDDTIWTDFSPFKVTLHTVTLVRNKDRYSVIVLIPNSDSEIDRKMAENEMDNLLNIVGPGKGTLNKISETLFPEQAEWNAIINKAKDSIEEGEFEKVVLARKKITKYNRAIHARDLMPVIENKGVGCFHILYRPDPNALFMSLTPERLFSLKNKTIQIDAIAGTRKRGMDSASDKMLEEEMLNSSKELHEHRLVSDQVEDFLKEWGRSIKIEKEMVLKLPFLQHLHTRFKAEIKSGITLTSIISQLHPTAAIGGFPKSEALDFIQEHEPFVRGLYASPIGYIQGVNVDIAVAIRSTLWKGVESHSFGGAGIVADSIDVKEWEETGKKLDSFEVSH